MSVGVCHSSRTSQPAVPPVAIPVTAGHTCRDRQATCVHVTLLSPTNLCHGRMEKKATFSLLRVWTSGPDKEGPLSHLRSWCVTDTTQRVCTNTGRVTYFPARQRSCNSRGWGKYTRWCYERGGGNTLHHCTSSTFMMSSLGKDHLTEGSADAVAKIDDGIFLPSTSWKGRPMMSSTVK